MDNKQQIKTRYKNRSFTTSIDGRLELYTGYTIILIEFPIMYLNRFRECVGATVVVCIYWKGLEENWLLKTYLLPDSLYHLHALTIRLSRDNAIHCRSSTLSLNRRFINRLLQLRRKEATAYSHKTTRRSHRQPHVHYTQSHCHYTQSHCNNAITLPLQSQFHYTQSHGHAHIITLHYTTQHHSAT